MENSTKEIKMSYQEYKADLTNSQSKGYRNAYYTMIEALNLITNGNKKDAFEMLAEMMEYQHADEIAKALNYDIPSPSFSEEDVPF